MRRFEWLYLTQEWSKVMEIRQQKGNKHCESWEAFYPNGWDKGNIHYDRFMSYSNMHYMLYLLSTVHWSKIKEMTRQKKTIKTKLHDLHSVGDTGGGGAEPSIRCLSHTERETSIQQDCKPPKALEKTKGKKKLPKGHENTEAWSCADSWDKLVTKWHVLYLSCSLGQYHRFVDKAPVM